METIRLNFEIMLYAFILFISYPMTRIVLQLAAQQHELTLTRHYEALLLSRYTQNLDEGLLSNTMLSESLRRFDSSYEVSWNRRTGLWSVNAKFQD